MEPGFPFLDPEREFENPDDRFEDGGGPARWVVFVLNSFAGEDLR